MGASVSTETAAYPHSGYGIMTLDDMTIDEKQIAEQARRDAIRACVLLVSMQFGDKAGESGYARSCSGSHLTKEASVNQLALTLR
jgi:hypothetical protein